MSRGRIKVFAKDEEITDIVYDIFRVSKILEPEVIEVWVCCPQGRDERRVIEARGPFRFEFDGIVQNFDSEGRYVSGEPVFCIRERKQ